MSNSSAQLQNASRLPGEAWSRRTFLATTAAAAGLALTGSPARAFVSREAAVKAALLFNFGRFIAWPSSKFESDTAPLRVGFYREDRIARAFAAGTKGKTAGKRPLELITLSTLDNAVDCHMVYAGAEASNLAATVKRQPVVSVSETATFLAEDGVIRLYVDGGKVKFKVNEQQASAVNLRVSGKLLKLAS